MLCYSNSRYLVILGALGAFMNKQLSIKDSVLFAVNGLISHPWYFVKMFLYWFCYASLLTVGFLIFLIAGGFMLNPVSISTIDQATNVAVNSTSFVIWLCIFFASFIYFGISVYFTPVKLLLPFDPKSPKPFTFGSFFTALDFKTVYKLFSATIIYGLIVTLGAICLIIPGIYFANKFQWVFYYIIDKQTGVIEGLKKSYARTTGHFWQLMGIVIIAAILSGLFILIPVAYLMQIRAYKRGN